MTTVAVIPARFASARFPGKALARDTGKFLVQHVCERVGECAAIDRVIVATDDQRVKQAVESFGGTAIMTRSDHATGTRRVAEVAVGLNLTDRDLVLNVQGDEPEISPSALSSLVHEMEQTDCPIGTLCAPFGDDGPKDGPGSPADPNCVKVVLDQHGRAIYFSRSLIPFPRVSGGRVDRPSRWLLHIGVYAFRMGALRSIAVGGEVVSPLAGIESLEQLAWLQQGLAIKVATVEDAPVGIDTPDEYAAFVQRYNAGHDVNRATV